jgi:O-antigen/teichoic acid export membrane protein
MPAPCLSRTRSVLAGASARSVRTLWSAEVVSLVATLASAVVVARGLGASAYGRFALLTTFAALLASFLDPRAGEIVTKYFRELTARGNARGALVAARTVLCLDSAAAVLAPVLTLAVHPLVSGVAPGRWYEVLLAALAAALLAPIVTARAVLASLDSYRTISRLQMVFSLVRGGALAAAALTGDVLLVLTALAASTALELAVTVGAAVRAVRVEHGALERGAFSRHAVREAVPGLRRFLLYSEGTTFLGAITKFGDTLALGALAGPEQAGFYRFAKSLTAPVANLTLPMQTVAFNRFVNVRVELGEEGMTRMARRASLLALPLVGALLLVSPTLPWIVVLLAGEEFRPAGLVAVVLLAGSALALPSYWLRPYYLVLDRLRAWFRVSLVVGVLSAVGFAAGAHLAGATGVATARILVVALLGNLLLALPVLRRRR